MRVAVVAHAGKSLGGGLPELRRALERRGVEPIWREVPKSRKAPKALRRVLKEGADLVVVWGGDGMVQRAVDTLAGTGTPLAIVPAGTANLLASTLGIPEDVEAAVEIALAGGRRRLDVGRVNGERFATMAGAGWDAEILEEVDGGLKDHLGRAGYVLAGIRNLGVRPVQATIDVDGHRWFDGGTSCVLFGNVGRLFGGVQAFERAEPDDGLLEIGVIQADGAVQLVRVMARALAGSPSRSPYARTTSARKARIRLAKKLPYELDGGTRGRTRTLKVRVEPGAIEVCVPPAAESGSAL
ncbi:MAG TPA: diacylglycerol kinase family protein [Miltoncostaeaceae bacterium]|nr:diacylglycerol kinase family protein [Miltoncostaeaceae bacterium]